MHACWRPCRAHLLAAIIVAFLALPAAAGATSIPLTGSPGGTNMAPLAAGGYLSSMQQCDAAPPTVKSGCGMYTMNDSLPASLRWSFAAPPSTGTAVASAYVYVGTRTGTLSLYVNGVQAGSSISIPAGVHQWFSFPAINVSPSDKIEMAASWTPGTRSYNTTLHVEFTENSVSTLIRANMTQPDEGLPEGVPCYYDWSGCDSPGHRGAIIHEYNPTTGATDPLTGTTWVGHGYHYLAPWGQAYNEKTGNPAPTDRVEVRGLQEWYLTQDTNTWQPVYTRDAGYAFGHTPVSSVTASSSQGCSTPVRVIDGIKNGLPNPYPAQCNEWASNNEGAGAWVKLSYSTPQDIRSVVLNDRPNVNDQVMAGTLTFDDGRSVPFGTLDNAGAGLTVQVPGGDVTQSVTINVTAVSSTTTAVGLEEVAPFATDNPQIGGALYPEDFQGASICAKLDTATDPGSTMASPNVDCGSNLVTGRLYHFFNQRVYVANPANVKAIVAAVQMRLAPTNPAGDGVNYVGNIGADVWGCASGCNSVDGMGESRFERLDGSWRTFVFDSSQNPAVDPPPPLAINAQPIPADQLR